MKRHITILGAGLVGSLLGIMLRNRGHKVDIYDRRPDCRDQPACGGRSINLTISARGWKALELAGLKDEVNAIAIPMYGRCMHQAGGQVVYQPYGSGNEAIYSVNRGELNKKLMTLAEHSGAIINFEQRCMRVDVATNKVHFELADKSEKIVEADLLFGADGAFSELRNSYSRQDGVKSRQHYLEYGYKELRIPAGKNGEWMMDKNTLHVWPRSNYMLIAMPNIDGSFTCTLFMPFEGEVSFAKLTTEKGVADFFGVKFPDAAAIMPTLASDFFANPDAKLITTHISKWHHNDKSALIGDAAHSIVPFYGQGMNAGFEDCTVLSDLLDKNGDDWNSVLADYEAVRKPNGEAVSQLAMLNFAELRDKVADPHFLKRKKIEKELSARFPGRFASVYEMVSFSHTPYDIAIKCVQMQDTLLRKIMGAGDFFYNISNPLFTDMLEKWVREYDGKLRSLYGVAA